MKFLYLACLALSVVPALRAQTNPASSMSDTNAALGAQTSSPIQIRSTEIQCDGPFWASTKSNVAVYMDNVRVDNPRMKLKCELFMVEAPKWTNGVYHRVTAETNVVIDWVDDKGTTNHATSDKAVHTYFVTNLASGLPAPHFETNSTVVLTGGNPTLTDPSGTFQADPIDYDLITGVISTPNLRRTVISNSPNAIATPGLQPSKTNAPAK